MASRESGLPRISGAGAGILTEVWVLVAVTLVLLAGRTYASLRITRIWDMSDWTIWVAMVLWLVSAILLTMEVPLGLGHHINDLEEPESQASQILALNTFFQMTDVVCTLFTKISITFFILRIKNGRTLRRVLFAFMLILTLATLQVLIVLGVSCIPMRKLWDQDVEGHCLPLTTVYYCAYVHSAFTVVTDLALTASPIVILWNVQIRKGRKTFICFLMSLGLVATFTNLARNPIQTELTSPDFTYAIVPISALTPVELASGIIAACIPPCVPLFSRRRSQSYTDITSQTARSKPHRQYNSAIGFETRITATGSASRAIELDETRGVAPLKPGH